MTAAPETSTGELISTNPRTGAEVARFAIADAAAVDAAVATAHTAAQWWGGLEPKARRSWLLRFRAELSRRAEDLAAVVAAETGKPVDDALLEVMLAVVHLDWAAKNAEKVLGRRSVGTGMLGANLAATVEYRPFGVVGVIGPWNYPVYTPMGSISYALAAGNAIVFKPSELTPAVGQFLADTWAAACPGQPVLQAIHGAGETGAALCRSAVDKLAFTGSAATARRVMATCAENLTPVAIEGGGKDAFIVDSDANIDSAVDAAVFGAFGNAGQTCAGVERVYVVGDKYDEFVDKLAAKSREIHGGSEDSADYGPATMHKQLTVIASHIDDALNRGGRAIVGGRESVGENTVQPVVLVDVPEDSTAVTEETFGPTVVVNRVKDIDEAIDRANNSTYGLSAAIMTKDLNRGRELARKLRTGAVAVNSFLSFASVPALPFGGIGDSGFGRIHGADGLREFSRPQSVAAQKFALPMNLLTFNRKARDMKTVRMMLSKVYSR
ncbi:Aldehyde dehydrogenase OS=Tsukamurella paurometabola (strain ATCC 8368 / DSM / CCUG 35730 /CIP 100753 / JCM 10117 / KCTC 9821 / NBRC 16120 / NCIMB 702349/ NCTC 13040) OX=521096 GN=Tpau_4187 PE=3 SV=1 [Tsukamurella paurometabola]|uniref:Aldehyde dehydrogenase n=1 Tax=Tsukamurella paurometabola (strain ATCC 8368 / DSM 20162 / CCUG 35730 / CIP 100753 / JCM 10117 / KCTC 9821 / NBRC 16120 / NCIMB 702349 / NCTC 13040) TaxID=521096 RepID=D5UP47_TSUPD|nr:aldehyde dehydrogenase family protein [Tsukamurella paurometabola]ADG80756.1 Aldehyde Dehydrogenase [Tsukamurella paurometabola DSM 20162]SUP40848.1 Succinate-semialdehyde dehydrogenase [NADP(+)] [Tsukamurella paurometabola]